MQFGSRKALCDVRGEEQVFAPQAVHCRSVHQVCFKERDFLLYPKCRKASIEVLNHRFVCGAILPFDEQPKTKISPDESSSQTARSKKPNPECHLKPTNARIPS